MDNDAGRNGNGMIWVAAGCGGLLLLTLCVATGFGAWSVLGRGSSASPDPVSFGPKPPQPTGPSTGPMMPTSPGSATSVEVNATVTVSSGSRPVPEGAICSFRVEHLPRSGGAGFWCRTQAVCGGQLLFGGPTAGYFGCSMSQTGGSWQIVGGDPDTTREDRDASFAIDTSEGTVIMRDDATSTHGEYMVVAHINSIR